MRPWQLGVTAVVTAVSLGAGDWLSGSTVNDAVRWGLGILVGIFFGLMLAKKRG